MALKGFGMSVLPFLMSVNFVPHVKSTSDSLQMNLLVYFCKQIFGIVLSIAVKI